MGCQSTTEETTSSNFEEDQKNNIDPDTTIRNNNESKRIVFEDSVNNQRADSIKKNKDNSINERIKGVWVSEEDSKGKIIIDSVSYISYYEKEISTVAKYTLSHKPCELDSLPEDSTTFYLSLIEEHEIELCYELLGLTDKHLSLMYLSNGKVFNYKKVKK